MYQMFVLLLSLCLLLSCVPALAVQPADPLSLQQGASGEAVRALQNRLIALGLLKGKADGLYGPKTAKAVSALQRHLIELGHPLQEDGIAGPETLRLCYDDLAVSALLDLKPGDKGTRVSELQARLYDLRFLEQLPDGAYGEQTAAAVRAFQEVLVKADVQGASVSGMADHVTRTALSSNLQGLGLRVPQTFQDEQPASLTGNDLYGRAALVMEPATGRVFLQKEASKRLYPASTTKIMTLILALETLPLDQTITIPKAAADVPEDSSVVPVTPGERMTVKDLLYGLMLRSGNDAANAVAVLCAGSVEAFVERMNQRAEQIGMKNTHFVNPHGYHNTQHYTTTWDLALLTLHGLSMPAFVDFLHTTEWTLQKTSRREPLLIQVSTDLFKPDSLFHYQGAWGIKSGYTRAAGLCYVGCADRNGKRLLAVVLNCRTRDQAWTDMHRLFNMGFALL